MFLRLLLLVGFSSFFFATSSSLFAKENAVALDKLTGKVMQDYGDFVQKIVAWQERYTKLVVLAKDVETLLANPPLAEATEQVKKEFVQKIQVLLPKYPQLQQVKQAIDTKFRGLQPKTDELIRAYQSELQKAAKMQVLQWSEEIQKDLQKRTPEFRQFLDATNQIQAQYQALQKAEAELSKTLTAYRDTIQKGIDVLKNPTQTMRTALNGKIAELLSNAGGKIGDVTCKLKGFDPIHFTKSPFDPNNGLILEFTYLNGQVKAEATGFYFKVNNSGVPEPVIDQIQIRPGFDLKAALGQASKVLVHDLLSGLDSPIQITQSDFINFQEKIAALRGGLRFGISFKMPEPLNGITAAAKDIVISPNGKILLDHVEIQGGQKNISIPIGTTPLFLREYSISGQPSTKKIEVTGVISPAAQGNPRSLCFEVTCGFTLTGKPTISVEGDLILANATLGTVKATLNRDSLEGDLTLKAAGNVITGKGKLRLDKTHLKVTGSIEVFGAKFNEAELLMNLKDGSGTLKSKEGVHLAGLNAESIVEVEFTPGFQKITLEGVLQVGVDLGFQHVNAAIELEAEATMKPLKVAAKAHVKAFGLKGFTIPLGSFRELSAAKLRDELLEQTENILKNTLDALGQISTEGSRLLAKGEENLRKDLSKGFKKLQLDKISTKNEQLNKLMGEIAAGSKQLHKCVNVADAGKWASDFAKDPGETLQNTVNHWNNTLGNIADDLFNGGSKRKEAERKKREAEEKLAKLRENEQKVDTKLLKLVTAINTEKPLRKNSKPGDKETEAVGYHLRFQNAVCALKGDKDAVIGFLIDVSGYRFSKGKRSADSDVKGGTIIITNLLDTTGKVRPKAFIHVPKLDHGCGLPLEWMARDVLACLIESHLPEAEIDGYQREKQLLVVNNSDEPIRVWIQGNTREHDNNQHGPWHWFPDGPGVEKKALVVLVPAKQQKRIERKPGDLFSARSIRIWAESETGRIWKKYQSESLWLLPESEPGTPRRYWATQIATYQHSFDESDKERIWKERTILVRNDTEMPIKVHVQAFTNPANAPPTWVASKEYPLDPGKAVTIRKEDSWRLHGSQLHIWASDSKDELYRWSQFKKATIPLVDKDGYKAKDLGSVTLSLRKGPSAKKADNKLPDNLDKASISMNLFVDEAHLPDVKTKILQQATSMIERLGFDAIYEKSSGDQAPVLSQTPSAGWHAFGSQVKLVVSEPVPNVEGIPLSKAIERIKQERLVAVYPKGTDLTAPVATQKPKTGYLAPGESIQLTPMVRLPIVKGLSIDQALTQLRQSGHKAKFDRSLGKADHVFEQKPEGGKWVSPESYEFTLTPGITIPDVTKEPTSQRALDRLAALGITPKIRNFPMETERPELAGKSLVSKQNLIGKYPVDVLVELDVLQYGPLKVKMPRVLGKTYEEAKRVLEALGMRVLVLNDTNQRVQEQKPLEGEVIKPGMDAILKFPPRMPPKKEPEPPPPKEGNIVGFWIEGESTHINISKDGTFNVVGVVRKETKVILQGTWSYNRGKLTMETRQEKVEATIKWINDDQIQVSLSQNNNGKNTLKTTIWVRNKNPSR